ncbi:MAG: HlyD family efflux transporter periplasmic adaptor subunit [Chlorobi bacterium]|nr:HlyD family efflux transporter periplasmic adaptor subunit [Chlorobiota bacterium]
MDKLILISTISIFLFTSCGENKHKADAYGNFEAKEIIISSEIPGKILKFSVKEGQVLNKNEKVCLIDTTDFYLKKKVFAAQKNSVASKFSGILAQVKVLEERKKVIEIEKNRINNLLKDSAATQKQADDINGKINILNKQTEQVKTLNKNIFDQLKVFDVQIENVNNQINKAKITNPIKGTVLTKYAEESEFTLPGKPLYKIADLSEITLRAYVSGEQISELKIGQKVNVFIDNTNNGMKKYEGVISHISNEAEFTPKIIQTKKERVNLVYAVKIRVKNDGLIKIGMPGEVIFTNK